MINHAFDEDEKLALKWLRSAADGGDATASPHVLDLRGHVRHRHRASGWTGTLGKARPGRRAEPRPHLPEGRRAQGGVNPCVPDLCTSGDLECAGTRLGPRGGGHARRERRYTDSLGPDRYPGDGRHGGRRRKALRCSANHVEQELDSV